MLLAHSDPIDLRNGQTVAQIVPGTTGIGRAVEATVVAYVEMSVVGTKIQGVLVGVNVIGRARSDPVSHTGPGGSGIGAFPDIHSTGVEGSGVGWVGREGEIVPALAVGIRSIYRISEKIGRIALSGPGAAVIGAAVQAHESVATARQGIDRIGFVRRDGHGNAVVTTGQQPVRAVDATPGDSAICTTVHLGPAGIDNRSIGGVPYQIFTVVGRKLQRPVRTAIGRAVETGIGPGDEDIRIGRVHGDLIDRFITHSAIVWTPVQPSVGAAPHPVTGGIARIAVAGSDINGVGIRRMHHDAGDAQACQTVGTFLPGIAAILREPEAPRGSSNVHDVGVRRMKSRADQTTVPVGLPGAVGGEANRTEFLPVARSGDVPAGKLLPVQFHFA